MLFLSFGTGPTVPIYSLLRLREVKSHICGVLPMKRDPHQDTIKLIKDQVSQDKEFETST